MARIVLWGDTAVQWYAHAARLPRAEARPDDAPSSALRPTARTTDYLAQCLPFLARPYHVAVGRLEDRRALRDARCHIAPPSALAAPHFLIASGVLLPSPELAFLEQCRGRTVPQAAAAASALCSSYALHVDGPGICERPPLASPASIRAACSAHGDLPGCGTVRRALPWIAAAAASPRESALALVLSLPGRYGGYGLPLPWLNVPIKMASRARGVADFARYIADLHWPSTRLIVEYDSDEHHLTSGQQRHDAVRRMALEEMGYRVLSVTRLQLNEPREMDKVAKVIALALGRQLRIRGKNFRRRQYELWVAAGLSRPSRP